jgi:hypothetical protein
VSVSGDSSKKKRTYQKAKIREEIVSCGRNPKYFINKYVKIKHPTRGIVPFSLWDFQKNLIDNYMEHRFNVVLKARQLGATETTQAFCLWMLLFYRNKNILCIATKAETAKNIIKRVRTAYSNLPAWLKVSKVVVDNKMSLEFDNGSVIKAIASSDDAGRSEAVSLLLVDEAAFIKNLDTLWTGLLPTVSAGGRVIMISTPNGVGNVFHKTFTEAHSKKNEFHANILYWWFHPEHIEDLEEDPNRKGTVFGNRYKTSTWFRNETKNMSDRDKAQEHDLDFLSSGDTFIGKTGIEYVESTAIDPVFVENEDGGLYIWSTPTSKTKKYFVSADVARGDGDDNGGFHVFETEDMMQAAEYNGKLKVDEFTKLMCDTAFRYNKAVVIVENNSLGLAVLESVRKWTHPEMPGRIGYPNVYCTVRGETEKGECVDSSDDIPDRLILGFSTTSKTRPLILNKLEEYIRTKQATFRSKRYYNELTTFIWRDGRPEAISGATDDLILSSAIGVYVRDITLAPGFNSGEMQKAMIAASQFNKITNNQIEGASKNPTFVPRQALGSFFRQKDTYRIPMGRGILDLRSLLKEE